MDLGDEAYQAIANALTNGQGDFSKEDLMIACNEIKQGMVKGELAALALEGKLAVRVVDGQLVYESTVSGRAELEDHLGERGISLEQFKEEMRRQG